MVGSQTGPRRRETLRRPRAFFMDPKIIQKWTEYSDEVLKRMTPTEDREEVAPLIAAILTLVDEVIQARASPLRPQAAKRRRGERLSAGGHDGIRL